MTTLKMYEFQLFVARDTQNSSEALQNLTSLCRDHLPQRHKIEVIDVTAHPERAMAAQIRMTPTLLKLAPNPKQRIVGTLQQTKRVLLALGLDNGHA
jgi:circadian clock protein KaiB